MSIYVSQWVKMHLCWVGCLDMVTSWSTSSIESLLKQTVIWSVGGQKDVRGFPALPSPIPYPRLHGHVTPNASCVTVNNPAFVKLSQIKANPLWIDFFVVVFINILVIILWFPPHPSRFLPSVFQNMCAWSLGGKRNITKQNGDRYGCAEDPPWMEIEQTNILCCLKKKKVCVSGLKSGWPLQLGESELCNPEPSVRQRNLLGYFIYLFIYYLK